MSKKGGKMSVCARVFFNALVFFVKVGTVLEQGLLLRPTELYWAVALARRPC